MTFRHLDLFAGIGGFSLAVEWLGGQTVAFVEWEAWNRRVLAKHWPEAQFYGDIRTVTNEHLRELGHIDLITGGYPCQPFSVAGQRRGADDPRHLWPEMRRVIDATRPRFVLAENVAGHITMGLDAVLADLEADGYTAGAVVVPAGAVNALHRRDRVWIMAHSDGEHAPERGQRAAAPGEGAERRDHGSRGHADDRQVTDGGAGQDTERLADTTDIRLQPDRAVPGGVGESEGKGRMLKPAGIGGTGQTARTLDPRPDGLHPGLVRQPATGPAERIRQAWADGSWETDLPRVVSDEPERRQKLMAAGNAIVPVVAYELLRVMLA